MLANKGRNKVICARFVRAEREEIDEIERKTSENEAKTMGAKWDKSKKKWYIKDNIDENKKQKIYKLFEKL